MLLQPPPKKKEKKGKAAINGTVKQKWKIRTLDNRVFVLINQIFQQQSSNRSTGI